jgi:hypothetical protein
VLVKRKKRKMIFVSNSWFRSVKLAKAVKLPHWKVDNGSNGNYEEDNNIECSYSIDKEQGENPNGRDKVVTAGKLNNILLLKDELSR